MLDQLFVDLLLFVQIILIDLVMAGDNAIIIGMTAAAVQENKRRQVIIFGIAVAVVLRIFFAAIAIQLFDITGIKLFGGILLLWVCWKLYFDIKKIQAEPHVGVSGIGQGSYKSIYQAIVQIAIADISMSLDNVLAVVAAAYGHPYIIFIGLFLSALFMMGLASVTARFMKVKWVAWIGWLIICYISIKMIWDGFLDVFSAITSLSIV